MSDQDLINDYKARRCAYCLRSAMMGASLMKCSGCLITYYCNRDHQVQDWKQHKPLCKELQAKRMEPPREEDHNVKTTAHVQTQMKGAAVKTVEPTAVQSTSISTDENDQSNGVKDENHSCKGRRESVIQIATSSSVAKSKREKPQQLPSDGGGSGAKKGKRAAGLASLSMGDDIAARVDEDEPKKDHGLNVALDLERDHNNILRLSDIKHDQMTMRLVKMGQFIAASLREFGWAVVDKFMGEKHCRSILKEMQIMHERGEFMEARLLQSKRGTQLQGVRSDLILYLANGSADGIHVGLLVSIIDSLIFQVAGSLPPYQICGRTKPMLTCYPGQRSRYLMHVDNPDQDGRCVTATYYLNEDWRPAHGGLLRLYPTTAFKPVDIEPIFDRLVLYWSDRRNPHEVLPSYRKRFSINTWYYDANERAEAEAKRFMGDCFSPTEATRC